MPDILRSDNGSVAGADYSNPKDPFGARLAGPFGHAVSIGLTPCSDSLRFATRPTLPGHSLYNAQLSLSYQGLRELSRLAVQAIGYERAPRDWREEEKFRRWALTSQSSARINALLAVVWGFPEIAVDHNDLDRAPWLLACENGRLNLRTCRLQPADPCDLITRCVAAAYEPKARSTEWDDGTPACCWR